MKIFDSVQDPLTGFPKRLKQAMETSRLRQSELARKAKLSDATISRLLRGENVPDPETVEAIARATGFPFRYLFMGETEPDSPLFENEGDLFRSVPMNRGKVGAGPAMLEEDETDGRPYAFQKDFLKRFGANLLRIFKVTEDPRLGASVCSSVGFWSAWSRPRS